MKKIVLVIKDAYSYAGTENICNFMSECFGDEHEVTIYSLEGSGQPFYPFEKVKDIISFDGEKNPIRSAVQRINQQGFDAVFLISMGRLSVMFAFYSLLSCKKKKLKPMPVNTLQLIPSVNRLNFSNIFSCAITTGLLSLLIKTKKS